MNLYAGLNLVCIYGYNIFDEDIAKRPTIIKNLGIMMAMYEIESLDNHVRIARLNGHKKVADDLERINLASKDDGDVRKQVRVTFENHFKLLKKSVMAQAEQAQTQEKQAQAEQAQAKQTQAEEEEEKSAKLAKETADKLTKEETEKEKNREQLENKLKKEREKFEAEKDAATKLAKKISEKQGKKMDVLKDNKESGDEESSDEKKKKEEENEFFKNPIGINEDTDKRDNLIKELIGKLIEEPEQEQKQEEGQQVVAKNYIKIIQNCLNFNVVPWHVVKYTIDEMLKVKEEKVNFSGLFTDLEKTLLDKFFTDAFYWNTYENENENEFVNDFRINVIRSTVTINDVYKSIRNLYIQNIQRAIQSKSDEENNKKFIEKFKSSKDKTMNPVYQKVLYDYFYKKYILNVEKGPEYFTDLYTSSSVEGIKIFYEGLENQVIRISQKNNEKFFMHAPGVMIEKKEKEEEAARDEIGAEAKLYFYDVNDKSFILDMMQKINIEEMDKILLSQGDNVMGKVYRARKHELRKYLNYFNIFMVAQAGNMKFIGKAYNRLRKQLESILDSKKK